MNTRIQEHPTEDLTVRFSNILVPTDFSDPADLAFTYALDLARRHGARIHLLHVIGSLESDAWSPLRYAPGTKVHQGTTDPMFYDLLRSVLETHGTEGVRVEPVLRHGSAVPAALLHFATKEGIDLIVMGTHGRHGLPRLLLGSVAERTVRRAPCSVLVVRGGPASASRGEASGMPRIQRLLVPLDFSNASGALLRVAHELAAAYDARLDLLHVVEPIPFAGLAGVMTANDLVPELGARADGALQRLWEPMSGAGVHAALHVVEGHAAERIVDFATRSATDLIVVAAHGHPGGDLARIGHVAERVVRTGPCSVLAWKRQPVGAASHPRPA